MVRTSHTQKTDTAADLAAWAAGFETTLAAMTTPDPDVPPSLAEAMRYAVQGGGKRVRAYITTRICELCGGTAADAAPAAVAIECVHAFSLVHDDLPAMDDDDLRRGRPTCHKAFGEAMAILAGDGLLALAFEIVTERIPDAPTARAAVLELARGTGWAGMVGGQVRDIEGEGEPVEIERVEAIHRYKTARLLESAARLGAICAKGDDVQIESAARFGDALGRAFQIADDLLDVIGDAAVVGKAVAKDAEVGKQTYPAAVGVAQSRHAADKAARRAIEALAGFGPAADDLRRLVHYVIQRDR